MKLARRTTALVLALLLVLSFGAPTVSPGFRRGLTPTPTS